MGYFAEINTLCRLPKDIDPIKLRVGDIYTNILPRERIIPLNIAILLIDANDFTFYGYGVVRSALIEKGKTKITFEILTLFNETERNLYTVKFCEAAKKTGEIK